MFRKKMLFESCWEHGSIRFLNNNDSTNYLEFKHNFTRSFMKIFLKYLLIDEKKIEKIDKQKSAALN